LTTLKWEEGTSERRVEKEWLTWKGIAAVTTPDHQQSFPQSNKILTIPFITAFDSSSSTLRLSSVLDAGN